MNAVVFEHVPVTDLPEQWRVRLDRSPDALVTVRIEDDVPAALAPTAPVDPNDGFTTDDPAFGIWRDRDDMADVAAYARTVRAPRINRDGSRGKP